MLKMGSADIVMLESAPGKLMPVCMEVIKPRKLSFKNRPEA